MPHPRVRDVSYSVMDDLKDCLMSMRTTISERNAMTLIAEFLLSKGSQEMLHIYNNLYCNDDYEGVVKAIMA